MSVLNRLLGSTESVAKHAEHDEEVLIRKWEEYLKTIPEKEQIVSQLPQLFGQRNAPLRRFKKLLELELAEVFTAEKDELDIVLNFHHLEHDKKIKRVHRLEQALKYYDTRHEYVLELLKHLYSILKSEARLLIKLLKNTNLKKYRKFVAHLKSEVLVEKTILGKIGDLETFKEMFSTLVRGEHIIHRIDSKEKRGLISMQKRMKKIFSDTVSKGLVFDWVNTVYLALDDKIHEGMLSGILGEVNFMDFEYVNRPEFVVLVRETIQNIRRRSVSEQMINVFVHIFREWYNHSRD